MVRDVKPGRAVVADRATGWPLADVIRERPGRWTVTVDGVLLAADRTRAGAVLDAEHALIRRGLLRPVTS